MNVQITYKNVVSRKDPINYVFFTGESFNISGLKKYLLNKEFSFVSDLLKSKDLNKNILSFDINSKKRIILISLKKGLESSDLENLGAKFYDTFKESKIKKYILNSETAVGKLNNVVGYFLHGLKLKSYSFEKYKTKKSKKSITIYVNGNKKLPLKDQLKFRSIEEGTFLTRDLVSEPGNVLHPDEYAKRLNLLKKDGLKVNIYDEKKLKRLGMHALLGVGQGSIRVRINLKDIQM